MVFYFIFFPFSITIQEIFFYLVLSLELIFTNEFFAQFRWSVLIQFYNLQFYWHEISYIILFNYFHFSGKILISLSSPSFIHSL